MQTTDGVDNSGREGLTLLMHILLGFVFTKPVDLLYVVKHSVCFLLDTSELSQPLTVHQWDTRDRHSLNLPSIKKSTNHIQWLVLYTKSALH